MEDIIIPIDQQLQEFRSHIIANPRTFLSSKFGDGKTYFIDKVKEAFKDEFVFLTIYPVNYQVAENQDIFNFIKRDILFQMMFNKMIPESIEIDNDVLLWGFIQNNYKSLLSDLIPFISSLALPAAYVPVIAQTLNSLKVFKDIKEKFDKFKEEQKTDDQLLEIFIKNVEKQSIYEEDIVTTIIKKSIVRYKEEHKDKKIVFIIEDLDRIDPAHLFRILNIFSAQIDYSYKINIKPDPNDVIGNKFGFDNIVFVADFSNVRKIFKHLYGENTDFNGYIGKFLSSTPYEYSFREIRANYIYDYLAENIDCPRQLIARLLPESFLESKTIRECIQAFNVQQQIAKPPIFSSDQGDVTLDITMLKLLSVMRRMKISDEDIIRSSINLFDEENDSFYKYIAPYMLFQREDYTGLVAEIITRKDDNVVVTYVPINPQTGQGEISNVTKHLRHGETTLTSFSNMVRKMLDYIVK